MLFVFWVSPLTTWILSSAGLRAPGNTGAKRSWPNQGPIGDHDIVERPQFLAEHQIGVLHAFADPWVKQARKKASSRGWKRS